MKKTLPLILVMAVLFNSAGYYVVYELNRYLIRKEIFSLLDHGYFNNSLSVLTVFDPASDPSFRRIDDREIEYRGNRFDILKETRSGKTCTFFCVHDCKEELLIAGMKTMHQKKQLINILQNLVTIALPVIPDQDSFYPANYITFPLLKDKINQLPAAPLPPPPELG